LSVVPLIATLIVPGIARAQASREITGKVTQAGTNAPLVDATVGVVGAAGGVRTNERGEYRIRVPQEDVTLLVRAIGYKRGGTRVPTTQTTADFSLDRDVLQLEGVTVTGAATTVEKKNAATAVSTVNSEELNRVAAPSLESTLQGKVVGASINMNNGAPGGGGQIQIRSAATLIGNIQPLFVVDGVVISNAVRSNRLSVATGSLNSAEENGTNRLADLNPNDIENIEILKGAGASAIYGSQAANGVVVISTKHGHSGAPRFDVTQRIGTQQLIRNTGTRHFATLDDVLGVVSGPQATAAAKAVCTPNCPYYDYIGDLYGRTDPSLETVLSASGGAGANTRYFASLFWHDEKGTAMNTGARHYSARANIDHSIGSRVTLALGTNLLRNFSQRGISNNDNALSSPIYSFGYTPAILPLQKKDANGNYMFNPFPSGTINASNPFQTFDLFQNNEDTYRLLFNGRGNWNALTNDHNVVNFTLQGGADRFSSENYILAPRTLQFQQAGTVQAGAFPGTAIQGNGTNLFTNMTAQGSWAFTMPSLGTATTTGGFQYETRNINDYNIVGRGLGPSQVVAAGATNTTVTNARSITRNQAFFAQEEVLLLGERLFLSGAVRGERSSVNGDRDKVYYFPRAGASYRFVSPVRGVNEFKLRASYGQAGNQAAYGDRDLVIAQYGLIGGSLGYGYPTAAGNARIAPERLAESEFGFDAAVLNERVRLEGTYYDRRITDLLVRPVRSGSTGITSEIANGGKMKSTGYEAGITVVPVQNRAVTWTSRSTWFQSKALVTELGKGVLPFRPAGAQNGFGNYGFIRYAPGYSVSTIWGNRTVDGVTTGNVPLADANPKYLMNFSNDVTWNSFALSTVIDYRHGGKVSQMTLNTFDEGGNTWDYDDPSPEAGTPLGEWRYAQWDGGKQTDVYLEDGSYTKVREISLTYRVPQRLATRIHGVNNATLSFAGRNLWIISGYNGFDPEVNNGGATVARFVDLAPFPPSRSFFLSVNLGF
jgi:TonB-linked SusC/RagA family outer membrane protein